MAKNCCTFPYCEEPKDKERGAGLCTDHAQRWINSPEWREASKDENVRFFMGLRAEKEAMRHVNTYKRKWMKRVSAEESGE